MTLNGHTASLHHAITAHIVRRVFRSSPWTFERR